MSEACTSCGPRLLLEQQDDISRAMLDFIAGSGAFRSHRHGSFCHTEVHGENRTHSDIRIGYAPGAYDLFHIGHLNLLRRAKEHCEYLIAGVVADEVLIRDKGVTPVIPLAERVEIVRNVRFVDAAIPALTNDKVVISDLEEPPLQHAVQGKRLAGHREGQQARARLRGARR
jgi:cytidyltransferase-like protein